MIPTSLYIHIPWCIRKCPYCDFNSHKSPNTLPETEYVSALIQDFKADLIQYPKTSVQSIFIGGGTPSLLSATAYEQLFDALSGLIHFDSNLEITLEANPGSVEQKRFSAYRSLGINRLSIGVQSFNSEKLKILGRIHSSQEAIQAINTARSAGFDNLNVDIMHGLPNQSVEEGMQDLKTALDMQPEHLSWYQLTIEPNTQFYKSPPKLPSEDSACHLEQEGLMLLKENRYERYEISAFAKKKKYSKHNLNYWRFGDYFGIGAGAHGKLSKPNQEIWRTQKHRLPKEYLNKEKSFCTQITEVKPSDVIFEFILNTTRLEETISFDLFEQRTSLSAETLLPTLSKAQSMGLVKITNQSWQVTARGRQYTNELQGLFLPD